MCTVYVYIHIYIYIHICIYTRTCRDEFHGKSWVVQGQMYIRPLLEGIFRCRHGNTQQFIAVYRYVRGRCCASFLPWYPLKMTIYSGFSYETWWFSTAMLNYQRVLPVFVPSKITQSLVMLCVLKSTLVVGNTLW